MHYRIILLLSHGKQAWKDNAAASNGLSGHDLWHVVGRNSCEIIFVSSLNIYAINIYLWKYSW